jgi:hypothetical protein
MKLLKRLLSGGPDQQAPKLETPSQVDGQEESRMTDLGSQTHTRRELLRVLTRDTLRYCGIPEGWVECQVLVVNTRKGETHMHARLVVGQRVGRIGVAGRGRVARRHQANRSAPRRRA